MPVMLETEVRGAEELQEGEETDKARKNETI